MLKRTNIWYKQEAGFNLVWSCSNNVLKELDIAAKYDLRVAVSVGLPDLKDSAQIAKLNTLIKTVSRHPAFYCYLGIDEPEQDLFPKLGELVAYIRKRDPAHPVWINLEGLFVDGNIKADMCPDDPLGTKNSFINAYRERLRLFIEQVKPDLLSYDRYIFHEWGDDAQYFLNLSLYRQAALNANIPFMNIVQACCWDSPNPDASFRLPNANEIRWLNYTTLAYGAQGICYYMYSCYCSKTNHPGTMLNPDGSTTPQYEAAKELNPQFIAIATELQSLRSLGAYHVGKVYWGATNLPEKAPFYLDFSGEGLREFTTTKYKSLLKQEMLPSEMPKEGMLLGYFGTSDKPTHVLVVNLNYKSTITTTLVGPDRLWVFDAVMNKWTTTGVYNYGKCAIVTLPPGGGKLIKVEAK